LLNGLKAERRVKCNCVFIAYCAWLAWGKGKDCYAAATSSHMSCRARPALALSALAFAVAAAVDERAVLAAACDAAAGKGCACCEANDATLLPPALVVSCRARPLLASSALAFALAAAVDERAVLAAACGAAAGEGVVHAVSENDAMCG
jgi:hypothetical protein